MADAIGNIDDTSNTGWTFTSKVNKDEGYFLEDIAHDGIQFVTQLWIPRILVSRHPKTKGGKNVVSFVLSETGFGLLKGDAKIKRTKDLKLERFDKDNKGPLGYYNPRLSLSATYEVTGLFDEPNQKLIIDQKFLFTPYSKDPSHEPGGILKAARIYPLIEFRVETTGDLTDKSNCICAVQAVYQFWIEIGKSGARAQYGIFHDLDRAGSTLWSGLTYLFSGIANTVFDRAEKPVLYEVVGKGIDRAWGGNWDNVHVWPDLGLRHLPATPGMPFGLHTHWRWGETAYDGSWILDGGPQFGGFAGAGTAIVDPDLSDQSLQFAITLDDFYALLPHYIDRDPDAAFSDLAAPCEAYRQNPKDTTDKGLSYDYPMLWQALTAFSKNYDRDASKIDPKKEFKGRLFVHGMFCAHESDDVLGTLPLNAYDAIIEPMPPNLKKHLKYESTHWRRPSDGEP